MSSMYFLVTIADRALLTDFVNAYKEEGVLVNFISLGHGTASNELRSKLGLESSEKAIFFSCVSQENWNKLKKNLEHNIRIDIPGTGIAFTVPMSSVGGKRELAFLTDGQKITREKESAMTGTTREALIVISNQGYNDTVMRAARAGGAPHGRAGQDGV